MHVELKWEVVSVVYLYQQSKSPQHVYRGSVEECNKAHAGTCPQDHAQGRQAHDRRAAAALSGYLYFPQSGCVKNCL